jgi:uncharacterized protein (DUF2141 family)
MRGALAMIRELRSSLLLVLLLLGVVSASAQTVTQIRNVGPRSNRLNLVVFSEGYTSAELATKFPSDAQAQIDAFLSAPPYSEYAAYMNIFTIAVASAQSGSDHPSRGEFKNTYFNSTYDSYGQDRLVTIPPNDYDDNFNNGRGKAFALLAQFVPEYDLVLMVVNDTQYGGSGGAVAIASINEFANEILIHESGHTFAALADEYDIDAPQITPAEAPNATQQTNRDAIKWHSWILPSTPIPTPETGDYNDVIGLFEGANYRPTGWYRPKQFCKMNTLGPPFCEVCAEALTLNVYKRISPIDDVYPAAGSTVTIDASQSTSFGVVRLKPVNHTLSVQWYIDNVAVAGATSSGFSASGSSLAVGQHTVRADVFDPTTFVRTDPAGDLRRSVSWTLNVTAGSSPSPAPLLNISTRLMAQSGENVMIGGFIITGTDNKRVLLRAIGPSLAQSGVGNPLPDPILDLHNKAGTIIASNDNWKVPNQAEIEATTVAPHHDLESALIATLAPAQYTAVMQDKGGASGVGLVEAYDLARDVNSRLVNISTRGLVQPGNNVMIGGFIVGSSGSGQAKIAVRALGPSLANAGINGALPDTILELHNASGTIVASNDEWKQTQQAEIASMNLELQDDRESALATTVSAGNYTAVVRGKNGASGVGLVEIYNVGR